MVRIGIALLIVQLFLLAGTLGFHSGMNSAAERDGIAQIIREAQ